MIFDILEKKVVDAGLLTPGVSLFREYMPAECQIGAYFRTPLQGIAISAEMRGWYRTSLQLITRHTDPVEGRKLASQIQRLVTVEGGETHPATAEREAVHIELFFPETQPIQFPRLAGNGLEWSQHFKAAFGTTF